MKHSHLIRRLSAAALALLMLASLPACVSNPNDPGESGTNAPAESTTNTPSDSNTQSDETEPPVEDTTPTEDTKPAEDTPPAEESKPADTVADSKAEAEDIKAKLTAAGASVEVK